MGRLLLFSGVKTVSQFGTIALQNGFGPYYLVWKSFWVNIANTTVPLRTEASGSCKKIDPKRKRNTFLGLMLFLPRLAITHLWSIWFSSWAALIRTKSPLFGINGFPRRCSEDTSVCNLTFRREQRNILYS